MKPALSLMLPGRVAMSFQRIPAGAFLMGQRGEYADEEPAHAVRITRDFYLGTFPVTQQQFSAWTESKLNDYARWLDATSKALEEETHENHFSGHLRHPAENMTWHAAAAFCQWMQRAAKGVPPGMSPLLPTEAEWEYACRWRPGPDGAPCSASSCATTEYYSGDGAAALAEVGWYGDNAGNTTHAVDERAETHPLGLHGMHGNVWEWCADAWNDLAYRCRPDGVCDPGRDARWMEMRETEPGATNQYPRRVLRGGAWFGAAGGCRSAIRGRLGPVIRRRIIGFRVCLVPGPPAQTEQKPASDVEPAHGVGGRGTSPETEGAGAADWSHARLPKPPA